MHLQNNCVVDILLRCECMYEVRIRFLKMFDPIVTEISSAHIERGLAHGSALSLDLSHFRLRILGCNKNMKISRSLQIMTPVTQIQNLARLAVLVLGKFSKTAPKFWFLQVFWTKKPFQRVVKCWDLRLFTFMFVYNFKSSLTMLIVLPDSEIWRPNNDGLFW